MTLLLANVLISTARAFQNPAGGTMPATTYLTQEPAHAEPVASLSRITTYQVLPAGALDTDYLFRVDVGVDIVTDDIITDCTLLDGITPWAQCQPLNDNETLRVVLADD